MSSRNGCVYFYKRCPFGFSESVCYLPELHALGMSLVYLNKPSCCDFTWLLLPHLLASLTLRLVDSEADPDNLAQTAIHMLTTHNKIKEIKP